MAKAGIAADRTTVVPNGPHPSCTPDAEPSADIDAARLLGHRGAFVDLLHVGSTIARKRIDVLLRVFDSLRAAHRHLRLIRVGGPFTAAQQALVRDLGLGDAIVVLPTLDRSTLAAVYRRSALLLMPSEREGFGLPVLEALACGTPVVASDVAALREVGGYAAVYCPLDDIEAWHSTVTRLLDERSGHAAQWTLRRDAGIRRAAAFSWSRYASDVAAIYVAGGRGGRSLVKGAATLAANRPVKVVHVGKFYPPVPGGMERIVQSLCAVTKGRLESQVLAFNTGRRTVSEEIDGVPVTRVGTWGSMGSVAVAPGISGCTSPGSKPT